MAELALRTTEFLNRKAKYVAWRPVGSVIVAISENVLRRKWCEIAADLVRPEKREQFRGIPGWDRLCQAWSKELWEEWFALCRSTKDFPCTPMAQDPACAAKFWSERIEPLGLVRDLPLAPESEKPVSDTWLWSPHERKTYFIVANTDAPDAEVPAWGHRVNWDAVTNAEDEVETVFDMPEDDDPDNPMPDWVAEFGGLTRRVHPDHQLLIVPRRQVKYDADLGLPPGKLADIGNPTKEVHPDFAAPVAATLVRTVDATALDLRRVP